MIVTPRRQKLLFQHIPKTGGQSIYTAFGKKLQPHLPLFHPKRAQDARKADLIFGVTRHPLERAISAYKWFASLHHNRAKRRVAENAAVNLWARNVSDVNEFYRGMDFEWCERFTAMFRPQSWFFYESKIGPMVSNYRVLRFENLSEDFAKFTDELGYDDLALPHINATTPSDWRADLAPDVKALLMEYYLVDFTIFGHAID